MKIFIPSRGRPDKQKTAEALRHAGLAFKIILSEGDKTIPEYRKLWPKHVEVMRTNSLCDKRAKLMRNSGGKVLMLDDDLTFFVRKPDGGFRKARTAADMQRIVYRISRELDTAAHVGLVDKFMSQHQPRGTKVGGRYNQVLGYNLSLMRKRAKKLGRQTPNFFTELNHDHDMHLQLLDIGLAPTIICEYSKDAKYYAEGGLKKFRTVTRERASFKKLKYLWPQYVTLRETRHSMCGLAATFKWRKALEHCKRVEEAL